MKFLLLLTLMTALTAFSAEPTRLKLLVVRANYSDTRLGDNPFDMCSIDSVKASVYSDSEMSVKRFIEITSWGRMSLATDVDVKSINIPKTKAQLLSEVAQGSSTWTVINNEVNTQLGTTFLSQYQPILIFAPGLNDTFDWGGSGRAVIWDDCLNMNNINHEIGHALGLGHSTGVWAADPFWSTSRITNQITGHKAGFEKDDTWDHGTVMGTTQVWNMVSHIGPHLHYMGWMKSKEVYDVTMSGTYEVEALENVGEDVKMLRIISPNHGHYYITYRKPRAGYSGVWYNIPNYYFNGVTLHADGNGFTDEQGKLEASLGEYEPRQLGVIQSGNSFINDQEKVSIKVVGLSTNYATVEVRFRDEVPNALPTYSCGLILKNAQTGVVISKMVPPFAITHEPVQSCMAPVTSSTAELCKTIPHLGETQISYVLKLKRKIVTPTSRIIKTIKKDRGQFTCH